MMRIAITGPESSGKTTLASQLAEVMGAGFIHEYARGYLEQNGLKYEQEDLDEIALGQLNAIEKSQKSINIVDTDFVVLKIWSEYKFGFASGTINKLVSEDKFDLHILCAPDIPWEPDPMRENPDDRHELFERYLDALIKFKKNYIIVHGSKEQRLKKSVETINGLLGIN